MAKGHHHHRHGYWTARRKRGAARLALVLVVLALFSIPAPRYYERRRARLTHIAALDPHFREEWEADRPWKLPGSCETRLGWKYVEAFEPSQKYKEGRFIVEKIKIIEGNDL